MIKPIFRQNKFRVRRIRVWPKISQKDKKWETRAFTEKFSNNLNYYETVCLPRFCASASDSECFTKALLIFCMAKSINILRVEPLLSRGVWVSRWKQIFTNANLFSNTGSGTSSPSPIVKRTKLFSTAFVHFVPFKSATFALVLKFPSQGKWLLKVFK